MNQTTALATRPDQPTTLRGHLDKMTPEFKKALPGHITAERFVRTAQTAIALTRNIEKVKSPQSLLAACSKAAADGLILDGREAALVVDYNGDVQYRPMMRGLLKLAYQSGQIKSLVVEPVRKNDFFEHVPTDPERPIIHKVNHREDRGDVFAVYALAELMTGGIVHEVMNLGDVNAIRDRSDAYRAFKANKIKSTPWATDWAEMARKTVFRRISKYLPSSTDRDDLHTAAERIDEDYTIDHATDGEAPPATPMQTTKKRGGAAAALKDVSPQKEAPAVYKPDDTTTGEVFDNDAPPADDPRFADHQDGDDI